MDRKILACMLAIGLVSVMATAATFTWLSDTETIPWTLTVSTADLTVSPENIEFPEAAPGESKSADITVKNDGDVSLTVTITGSGDYVTFTMPDPFDLNPGQSKIVSITITVNEGYTESGGSLSGDIVVDAVQEH